MRLKYMMTAGLAALACGLAATAARADFDDRHDERHAGRIRDFGHIVVIYQENHSFDNLYGNWGDVAGKRVNDLRFVSPAHAAQARLDGSSFSCLLQNDVNLASPTPLATSCTDTVLNGSGAAINSAFVNAPFKIDSYIAATDKTCAAPGVSAAHGVLKNAAGALPGGCTEDIVHRFYSEQFQINGGRQNRYLLGSDAAGLTMGYYDTTKLPIYKYLHERGAPHYVIADNFFQAAFGGSFLNHQWLVAARTPTFVGADNSGGANDLHSALDANLSPRSTPLYTPPTGSVVVDAALTQSCAPARGALQSGAVCGDLAINTIQPYFWPYAPGTADAKRLPPLAGAANATIGDRLSEKGVDWAWYSGGWDNAEGNASGLGWTNAGATSTTCTDPNAVSIVVGGKLRCPDKLFQYHHQPLNYFANFAPGAAAREQHLLDVAAFVDAAKRGRMKPVSFVKLLGEENEHPGYASESDGSRSLVDLVETVLKGPNGHDTLIVITYDEFGGSWDHVPPPPHNFDRGAASDVWGPGTRIPALLISKRFERSGVDHVAHDTTSILKLIEQRYDLAPLGPRDASVHSLAKALRAIED
jgi:acid phosphatase